MSLAVFNGAVIRKEDLDNLNVVEGSRVTVRKNSDNSIVQIYSTNNNSDPKPNPFTADDTGAFLFWVESGTYKIEVITLTDVTELSNSIVTQIGGTGVRTPIDYGATGSGDETAIIQDYMDNEDIWLFPAFFTVSSKLQVTDRRITCLPGAGGINSIILNDTVIEFLRCNDSLLDGFRLDMSSISVNDYEDTFHDCLRVEDSERFTLANSFVTGAPVQAVNFLNCPYTKITGNTIYDSGRKQRLHPVSNISIGGALIVYNSAYAIIDSNSINRSWSTCIFYYSEASGDIQLDDNASKTVISNNNISYSQSNGIRINGETYADFNTSTAAKAVTVSGNNITDVARSCIRPNGLYHVVDGNSCTYTGQPIYGVSNIEPDGIASNHCKHGVWSNNLFFNVGAAMFLVPNNLVNYGCEDLIISNNKAVDCGYLIARAAEVAAAVNNISVSNCQSINPHFNHIQMYNTGKLYFSDLVLIGRSATPPSDTLPAFRFQDNTEITIDNCKTEGSQSAVTSVRADKLSISNCDFQSTISCIGLNNVDKVKVFSNKINFNSENIEGATGIAVDNCDYIRISDNDFESDATETTAAILIANTDEVDPLNPVTPTYGHVKNNTFDTLLGINNQTNQFDGDQFQQTGNIHVGELNQFETHLSPTIESAVSYHLRPRDSGKTVSFTLAGQILNIPDGLEVGYYVYCTGPTGFSINMTGFEILNGPTVSVGAGTFLIKKISAAFWQVSN